MAKRYTPQERRELLQRCPDKAKVDQRLEAVMRRLAFALSSREAADAVKELVETLMERKS